jgi:energy-coupling factor transport system permease protein
VKQPWVWVFWLATNLVILSISRNPLYLVLILLSITFVGITLRQSGSDLLRPISIWKLAVWIILLATIFNALTSHYGSTIFFVLPGNIPLISGKITLEAMVYGAINGLILTGMLASFSVLNQALPVRDLIGLIPRAFFPMAVVISIAVTYMPTTIRQFQQIREAQAVRGHQMRSVRDWLPLLMPLLIGGLEHAMQLAEAMTARGFARMQAGVSRRQHHSRIAMLIGMFLLVAGWILQLRAKNISSIVFIALGTMGIAGGLWYLGKQSLRSTYQVHTWLRQDWITLAIVVVVLCVCIAPIAMINHQTLFYEPYPKLTLPPFDPWIGLALLGITFPGVLVLAEASSKDKMNGESRRQLNDRTSV